MKATASLNVTGRVELSTGGPGAGPDQAIDPLLGRDLALLGGGWGTPSCPSGLLRLWFPSDL